MYIRIIPYPFLPMVGFWWSQNTYWGFGRGFHKLYGMQGSNCGEEKCLKAVQWVGSVSRAQLMEVASMQFSVMPVKRKPESAIWFLTEIGNKWNRKKEIMQYLWLHVPRVTVCNLGKWGARGEVPEDSRWTTFVPSDKKEDLRLQTGHLDISTLEAPPTN